MKGARWVRQRYFRRNGYRFWDFATEDSTEGDTCGLQLFRATTVAIQRHVKIRGLANPFDPAWTTYFARRRTAKRSVGLPGAAQWC
jgi:RNA-directed DNA polymerase